MNVVAVCIHAPQTQHAQAQMEITLVLVKMALQEMEHFAQVKNLNNFKTSFLETILKIYCNSKLSAGIRYFLFYLKQICCIKKKLNFLIKCFNFNSKNIHETKFRRYWINMQSTWCMQSTIWLSMQSKILMRSII